MRGAPPSARPQTRSSLHLSKRRVPARAPPVFRPCSGPRCALRVPSRFPFRAASRAKRPAHRILTSSAQHVANVEPPATPRPHRAPALPCAPAPIDSLQPPPVKHEGALLGASAPASTGAQRPRPGASPQMPLNHSRRRRCTSDPKATHHQVPRSKSPRSAQLAPLGTTLAAHRHPASPTPEPSRTQLQPTQPLTSPLLQHAPR